MGDDRPERSRLARYADGFPPLSDFDSLPRGMSVWQLTLARR
jgi:hypothetical protein